MSLKFGSKTDVGRKRRSNQDNFAVVRGEALNGELDALFVLADGMGGKLGGEVASDIVVRTVPEVVSSHLAARNGDKRPVEARQILAEAIRQAHRGVKERQDADSRLEGMGTTCVAAILDANRLTVANVGDSRAYLLRDGEITQITDDHSSVWEQVMAGNMSREEARASRFRNQITRAVGSDSSADPDIETIELQDGDSVLFCSDGLSSELPDEEIARLFAGIADPQAACEALVDAALDSGGRDNITVLALRFGEFKPVELARRSAPIAEAAEDPLDAWRRAGLDPALTHREQPPEGRERVYARSSSPISPVLFALLFLLAVAAGGEGYALARVYQELNRIRRSHPAIEYIPEPRATDRALIYGAPVVFSTKPVRDTPLAVDDESSVLAASTEGSLIKIDRKGRVLPFPDQSRLSGKAPTPWRDLPLLTIDASGNRYEILPGGSTISKFDPDGRAAVDADGAPIGPIGRGGLVKPTALAVDRMGNLYVIDQHLVKKISAIDAAPAPAAAGGVR